MPNPMKISHPVGGIEITLPISRLKRKEIKLNWQNKKVTKRKKL